MHLFFKSIYGVLSLSVVAITAWTGLLISPGTERTATDTQQLIPSRGLTAQKTMDYPLLQEGVLQKEPVATPVPAVNQMKHHSSGFTSSTLMQMKETPDFWEREVKKSVDLENNHPCEMMQSDRYYWYHYLQEQEPEIE